MSNGKLEVWYWNTDSENELYFSFRDWVTSAIQGAEVLRISAVPSGSWCQDSGLDSALMRLSDRPNPNTCKDVELCGIPYHAGGMAFDNRVNNR